MSYLFKDRELKQVLGGVLIAVLALLVMMYVRTANVYVVGAVALAVVAQVVRLYRYSLTFRK